MMQPLTDYFRDSVINQMAEAYGPYLEKLTKDEKYCLIGFLALWQQRVDEGLYTDPGYELSNIQNILLDDYPTGRVIETIVRNYLLKLNEPQVLRLIEIVATQLREGCYRRRGYGEYDQLPGEPEPFCDLSDDFQVLDPDGLDAN